MSWDDLHTRILGLIIEAPGAVTIKEITLTTSSPEIKKCLENRVREQSKKVIKALLIFRLQQLWRSLWLQKHEPQMLMLWHVINSVPRDALASNRDEFGSRSSNVKATGLGHED
ncbi:hypothetical protein VNO77_41446 [Canavalia gladiata]|uniref:Uncharacterized protein n=1 Tax=Canavalia gladiata TaxID=3824 RepID=A0AAN9K2I0_CANGL